MDIVTTSLDALLQRATNPANQNVDTAAVEAFCVLINKEKDGSHIGVKLIAPRLHSTQEKEVLQTLNILDTCMQKCGSSFQSEVGKFRFLNEMIKLVSPKYLGLQTPVTVKQKVLQLIYLWTLDYPKESKIRDAYEMLRRQGVIKDPPVNMQPEHERPKNSIFCDEEKSKLLQKLLQSKNPDDLHAANRLIKCMVKEDDKRAEMKNRKILEIESVYNNVRLLKEMLDSYKKNGGTSDDMALIKELYQNCERLKPKIIKIASESQHSDDIIATMLNASDELGQVIQEYEQLVHPRSTDAVVKKSLENGPSLLDLDVTKAAGDVLVPGSTSKTSDKTQFDVLCDIFSNANSVPAVTDDDILKPISLTTDESEPSKTNGKLKAFEQLDALGETLLKQNLQSAVRQGHQFQKNNEKIPMNQLSKKVLAGNELRPTSSDPLNFDLNYLLEKSTVGDAQLKTNDQNSDDLLVDISDDATIQNESPRPTESTEIVESKPEVISKETPKTEDVTKVRSETKLSDIFVSLESVKPSSIEPVIALEEKNGISVTLHFARDKPRDDVIVIVVTIVSKNQLPLKNILFRAIVPKVCKVKLQSPSGTELPAFNPFLPPSAITQIMLISNPEKVSVSLKFIVSYNIDDETTTEMGEIDSLPNVC